MAQKFVFFGTAKKLSINGKNPILLGDTPQSVGLLVHGTSLTFQSVPGSNGTTDTLINTSDGITLQYSRNFATFAADISATDCTGS